MKVLLCIALGLVLEVNAETLITFDGPPLQPTNTQFAIQQYSEAGLVFKPLGPLDPAPPYRLTRNGGGIGFYPANGSAYLQTGFGQSLEFFPTNGGTFNLLAVDLAEYSTVFAQRASVTFVGYKTNGATVSVTFVTDGLIDGTGPMVDFQTFVFGPEFSDVARVVVPTVIYSLDNLRVEMGPVIRPGPVVGVTAVDSEAREISPLLDIPENPASFRVWRSGSTNMALTVNVLLSGTASNGVDYEFIPNTITIPAGSAAKEVFVSVQDDEIAEGTETVALTLVPTPCPECYVVGNNSTAIAYIFDDEATNRPPITWISRPHDGESFTASADIPLRAVAHDGEDGYDIAVEFFEGTNRIGAATFIASLCPAVDCPSFDLIWSNVPPGVYTLTAKATDKGGAMTVSAPVHVTVVSNGQPRVVFVTPHEGETFPFGTGIFLGVNAFADAGVARVDFYTGTNFIGQGIGPLPSPSGSHGLAWEDPPVGFHTLFAVATDTLGRLGTSAPVHITVVSNLPPGLPVVTITATDSNATETVSLPNDTGRFTFTRSGETNDSLMVYFSISGTASNLADYVIGANWITIPPGYRSAHLIISPTDDAIREPVETVVLRVEPPVNPLYVVGWPSNATIYIRDNDSMPTNQPERTVISVVAADAEAYEPGVPAAVNPGHFAIRRTGNLAFSIPVLFTLSGSAANGMDYMFISNRVVIPAGSTQALVQVVPLLDELNEGTETVVLSLQWPACPAIFPPPPECYEVGMPGSAEVFIHDSFGTNHAPVVQLNEPADGSTFNAPTNIVLRAFAQDAEDGHAISVEFFAGTNRLGAGEFVPTLCPAPYCPYFTLTWSNVPVGSYSLTARATDSAGATTISAPARIGVRSPTNPPPVDHTVVTVIATDSHAQEPGATDAAPGQFAIRRAGNLSNDVMVFFAVGGSASNGVDYVTISNRVLIPAGATQAVINILPIGDDVPEGTETVVLELRPPVCAAVFPPPPGCYVVGSPARATVFIADASAPTNRPPMVELVNPPDGSLFVAPADILLIARANDPDGFETVRTVEFFAGGNSLGIRTNYPTANPIGPFFLIWSNVAVGEYTLTARVADDAGVSAISLPIHVRVLDVTITNRPAIWPWPRLRIPPQCIAEVRTNGCRLLVSAETPMTCVLESTVDLLHWIPLCTNTLSVGEIELRDCEGSSEPLRFYRVRPE